MVAPDYYFCEAKNSNNKSKRATNALSTPISLIAIKSPALCLPRLIPLFVQSAVLVLLCPFPFHDAPRSLVCEAVPAPVAEDISFCGHQAPAFIIRMAHSSHAQRLDLLARSCGQNPCCGRDDGSPNYHSGLRALHRLPSLVGKAGCMQPGSVSAWCIVAARSAVPAAHRTSNALVHSWPGWSCCCRKTGGERRERSSS